LRLAVASGVLGQLDEAITLGSDPLHLAAVFGIDPKTAIRYADNARALLATTAARVTGKISAHRRRFTSHDNAESQSRSV
jgi:hypothetical protein